MSECATCGSLADRVEADLEKGEALPTAVSQLEAIAGGNARRCPTCRALFLYTYDYEYGAMGDGWETAAIERVDRDRVVAVLLDSPPSAAVTEALAELGVAGGDAAITTKLVAELDDPKASHDAARKLVAAALAQSDIAAIERLLRHPRAKVRADTLYLLQAHRGSLIFRAAASATEPSPAVREAATTAAFVDPPRDAGLVPAIIACLDDPEEDVRSNAAWTLAVFAEDQRDVSAALPALATRFVEDVPKVRITVARALIGAARAGTDCWAIVSVIERLDPSDELRNQVLDAILTEALRTKRVDVWRCPKCGSTDAGPDESRSRYEFTYMHCNGCKSGGLVDSYERDSDWSLTIDVPIHYTELPSHVAPLAPGEGFYESMQAAARKAEKPSVAAPPPPPPAPVFGCSRCYGEDAAAAWNAIRESAHQTLVSEDRWSLELSPCSCGQTFAVVFTERVDYRSSDDDLTWLALPVTSEDRTKLACSEKRHVPWVLTKIGEGRRFLVRHRVGGAVDAWWRTDGFALDPSNTTPADPPPELPSRDTPIDWLMDSEEVAALWALGIPLEAACVPDELLRVALACRRVKRACSSSSMGTAETYWALAQPTDRYVDICRDGVVVPPGETAQATPFEARADDRDVDGVLWAPFLAEQRAAVVRSIPYELRRNVVDEYVRVLADLEERWATGPKQIERAPFIEWLRNEGPVDAAELERWLAENTKQSVRHLVQGIRARWITHDVEAAFAAVMTSVERFKMDADLQRSTRIELLRAAARVVRSR